jgi:RHS repeat-associated protein
MKTKTTLGRLSIAALCCVLGALSDRASAQEDDYEFLPLHAWSLGETGGEDATAVLAEGFPGLGSEPGKDRWIEPVDGAGGFDNVAPRLGAEEGPGGLEFDPSPTYRTRFRNGTNYLANGTNRPGNNWFLKLPYAVYNSYSNYWTLRFDANTFRRYDWNPYASTYDGRYGNSRSRLTVTGTAPYRTLLVYDISGKVYTCLEADGFKCSKIDGLGDAEITVSYAAGSITLYQKPSATGGSEVRRFLFTLTDHGNGLRIDKVDVAEKQGGNWITYRTLDFTYHEQVTGAVGSSTGDLIGIEETRNLTESGKTYARNQVFKYFTGTFDQTSNPGYPYQVEAVLEPGAVKAYLAANPTETVTDIYKKTAAQLASYVDRTYKYFSDRRLKELALKSGCGCGGSSGTHTYAWDVNGSTPTDLNTWYHRVTITLPTGAAKIIDYNLYGQVLNSLVQEVAGNPSSRRWIRTFRHDTTGRLTDSYSVKACTSYSDSTHVVTTNTTAGMIYRFAYDSNSALSTVKLRDPANGNENFQLKKVFTLLTSGSYRKRYVLASQTVYPTETTTDTGGKTTSFTYSTHTADSLAVKKRTTTLPVVSTGENGSGSAVVMKDYFELDGLHTWSRDGENRVHYTAWDANRRTATKSVRDIDTDAADRPAGVPAPPETDFESSTGLNLVQDSTYDEQRRLTKSEGPAFNAWNGSSVVSTRTTGRRHYSKLSGGELVVLSYPHIDTSYFHAAVSLTVLDFEGNAVTNALGELNSSYRDTNLADDFDEAQATLAAGFQGTIIQRSDSTYSGGKLTREEVWSDADNSGAAKFTTVHVYDAAGRRETSTNPAGTITRVGYDVLGRTKTRKVGTVDGGAGDNMTLVEELFFDDEEDSSSSVGDGFLTRRKLYTSYLSGGERITDYLHDYRGREVSVLEPLQVSEDRTYDNLNRTTLVERWDDSTNPSTLLAKSQTFYDSVGRPYEERVYGISGGAGTGYAKTSTWRDGRGLVVKTLSQGTVLEKTQYDGAGRAVNSAVSHDAAETAYADAFTLTGDTVVEETRSVLDALGRPELVRGYFRKHNGTGTGALTLTNARAQYTASWFDPLHRSTHGVSYGDNDGTDMTARPSGNPPSASDSTKLVAKTTYTPKSQVENSTDPQGIVARREFTDWGAAAKEIQNYLDGTPGPGTDEDRTVEHTYDTAGRPWKITAKASGVDQVTETVYGVTRGSAESDSKIASNDLVSIMKNPDPSTGLPGGAADQESFAYNAQGERTWMKGPAAAGNTATEHVYVIDDRGRLIHDRVTVLGTGLDGAVRRISRTYTPLDQPEKVTSWDNATVGSGSVVNEVQIEYGKFGVTAKIHQDWDSAVTVGVSPKVEFAHSFPTDGTTGLRRTSTTHRDGTVIEDVYNAGTDDLLSRLTGRKKDGAWLFQESYLGLGSLEKREFGNDTTKPYWSLVEGTGGRDRYLRPGDLIVKDSSGNNINRYQFTYNHNSQVTLRKDLVGNVGGQLEFDEKWTYDGLSRMTEHLRGKDLGGAGEVIRVHECWTLDRSGNTKTFYSGTAASCGTTWTGTFNASNEMAWSQQALEYDDPGNMKKRGAYTVKFDGWNREVLVQDGTTDVAVQKFNGLNQKVYLKNAAGTEIYFYYNDAWQLLEEQKVSTGAVIHWYVWGTQYIDDLVVEGPTVRYQVNDPRSNVVTRIDAAGAVYERVIYEKYGGPQLLSADWSTWQSFQKNLNFFTGRYYNKDVVQNDFRNRFQDPELGVFVTRDPIGTWGDPGSWGNGYAYVGSDPTNDVDPFGEFSPGAYQLLHAYRVGFRAGLRTLNGFINNEDIPLPAGAPGRRAMNEALFSLILPSVPLCSRIGYCAATSPVEFPPWRRRFPSGFDWFSHFLDHNINRCCYQVCGRISVNFRHQPEQRDGVALATAITTVEFEGQEHDFVGGPTGPFCNIISYHFTITVGSLGHNYNNALVLYHELLHIRRFLEWFETPDGHLSLCGRGCMLTRSSHDAAHDYGGFDAARSRAEITNPHHAQIYQWNDEYQENIRSYENR